MHTLFKLTLVAATLGMSSIAFAQAKSDVKINGTVEQRQDTVDSTSRQLMDLGSVKSGGSRSSDVTVTGTLKQTQLIGSDALQSLEVGNVEANGSSKVVINNLEQHQGIASNDAHQVLQIGSVLRAGDSKVFVNNLRQIQTDADKAQQEMRIGVIK